MKSPGRATVGFLAALAALLLYAALSFAGTGLSGGGLTGGGTAASTTGTTLTLTPGELKVGALGISTDGGYRSTVISTVAAGGGDYVLNHVANSDPALANYGGSLELGGKGTNNSSNADVYLGAMQARTAGYLVQILNSYGNIGGTEASQFSVLFDGDTVQNGHVTVGGNKSDGRVQSAAGSLYLIAAGGPLVAWNKGAQNIMDFYTGAGTLMSSVKATGQFTTASYYESTGSASSAGWAVAAGQLGCLNTNATCTTQISDSSGDLLLLSSTGATLTEVGTSTGRASVGGSLSTNTTGVGNVGASGPDDLQTYAIPANSLVTSGRGVRIRAYGTTANNANAKTVSIVWGSQTLLTKQLTVSVAGTWSIEATCIRTGASTQDCMATADNHNGSTVSSADSATAVRQAAFVAGTQTETAAITVKTQSTVSTSNNDIIGEGLIVSYF